MDATIAGESLENAGVAPELGSGGFLFDGFLQLGVLIDRAGLFLPFLLGAVERDIELVRNHPRDTVGVAVAPAEDAADIADDALRSQGAEGDNLGDGHRAVLLADILDHLAPSILAEVDVDIGGADTVGVQESLEKESVTERIEIGDSEHIGDQ